MKGVQKGHQCLITSTFHRPSAADTADGSDARPFLPPAAPRSRPPSSSVLPASALQAVSQREARRGLRMSLFAFIGVFGECNAVCVLFGASGFRSPSPQCAVSGSKRSAALRFFSGESENGGKAPDSGASAATGARRKVVSAGSAGGCFSAISACSRSTQIGQSDQLVSGGMADTESAQLNRVVTARAIRTRRRGCNGVVMVGVTISKGRCGCTLTRAALSTCRAKKQFPISSVRI